MPEDLQGPEVQVHHKVQDWILHKDQQVPEASEEQRTEQAAGTAADTAEAECAVAVQAAGTAADTAEAECTVAVLAAGIAAVRTAGAGCIAVQAADIEAAYTAVVQAAGTAAGQVPEVQEQHTVLLQHTALQQH